MSHAFTVGQHVHRIEDREVTGATILAIVESHVEGPGDEASVELEYDEGGKGWWSVSSIRADS
jgi:hypothetical protein